VTKPALQPQNIRRILVVKRSSLGDIVHFTPCLRALRRWSPHAQITMVVDRAFADVVRQDPNLDGLVEVGFSSSGWSAGMRSLWPTLGRHSRPGFDLAIDFQGKPNSAWYVYVSRARWKVGRGRWRPGWDCVVYPDLKRHAVHVCAEIAGAAGVPVADLDPQVHLSAEADAALVKRLTDAGLPSRGFLLINPFTRWPSKEWPRERYARLMRMLVRDTQLPIVVSGGRDRRNQAAHLMSLLDPGEAISLVGQLSLAEAMCLYGRAAVMVTGDSGPMHIAAALGTKLVALFGPTLPEQTGPWGSGHRVIQRKRPSSHHAYVRDRGGMYIRAIEVSAVYGATMAALGESVSSRAMGHGPCSGRE
jgi:ADP-heptose:LPS heptosyltransferase